MRLRRYVTCKEVADGKEKYRQAIHDEDAP
jgi:hypothetical protein